MYSERVVASWCLNSLICGLYVCVYRDYRTRRWQGRSAQQEMRGAERQKRRRNDAKCVNPGMKILIQSPPGL